MADEWAAPCGIPMPRWAVCEWEKMGTSTSATDRHPLAPRYAGDGYVFVPEAGACTNNPAPTAFVVLVMLVELNPLRAVSGFEVWGLGPTLEEAAALALQRAQDAFARWSRRRQTAKATRRHRNRALPSW